MYRINAVSAFVTILAAASAAWCQAPPVIDADSGLSFAKQLGTFDDCYCVSAEIAGDGSGEFSGHDCWCPDGIGTRDHLAGDLWGARSGLAAHGIIYDAQLTQFYQGGAAGGAEQTFRYGGKLDQYFILDSQTLGLWKGMTVVMHGETGIGEDVILDTAGLHPPKPSASRSAATSCCSRSVKVASASCTWLSSTGLCDGRWR